MRRARPAAARSSAYAFRNRRQGRAFAKMWDAILIHRARARLAAENQARAIAGCVSLRKRGRRARQRISLSRQPPVDGDADPARPARRAGIAQRRSSARAFRGYGGVHRLRGRGGDLDAFVEARRPQPPRAAAAPADPLPRARRPAAIIAGCPDYRDVHPNDIEVRDLDPTRTNGLGFGPWIRAFRSGFMIWLDLREKEEPDYRLQPRPSPLLSRRLRNGADARPQSDSDDPRQRPSETEAARPRRGRSTPPTSARRDRRIGPTSNGRAPGAAASSIGFRSNSGTMWPGPDEPDGDGALRALGSSTSSTYSGVPSPRAAADARRIRRPCRPLPLMYNGVRSEGGFGRPKRKQNEKSVRCRSKPSRLRKRRLRNRP